MNKILFSPSSGTYQPVTRPAYKTTSLSKMTTHAYLERQQLLSFFEGLGASVITSDGLNAAEQALGRLRLAQEEPIEQVVDRISDGFKLIRD